MIVELQPDWWNPQVSYFKGPDDKPPRPKPKQVQAYQCPDCKALWLKTDEEPPFEHYVRCIEGFSFGVNIWTILYPRSLVMKDDD